MLSLLLTVKTVTRTGNVSNDPEGIAVDVAGNFYMGNDLEGNPFSYIWKVTPSGTSSIFAGQGPYGQVDGPLARAYFNSPWDLVVDSKGNIYTLDAFGSTLRKLVLHP